MKKKVLLAGIITGVAVVIGAGGYAGYQMSRPATEKAVGQMGDESGATEDIDGDVSEAKDELQTTVEAAVDSYIEEHNGTQMLLDVMDEDDIDAFGIALVDHLTQTNLSEGQKDELSGIIQKILKEDESLTMATKITLTDAAKDYISASITEALKNGDSGQTIETIVEKTITQQIKSGDVQYSLTDSDISKIREQVVKSLGDLKGADGRDGKDGATGPAGANGRDGSDGKNGNDGKDGIDGKNGENGKDGKDGADGRDGRDGKDGINGKDGADGKDGINGKDGADGKDGIDGKNGADGKDGYDGKNGADGYTPVKGKDYFTEDEIKAISDNLESVLKGFISNDVTAFTNALKTEIVKTVEENSDELKNLIAENQELSEQNAGRLDDDEEKIGLHDDSLADHQSRLDGNDEKITSNAEGIAQNSSLITELQERLNEMISTFTEKDEELEHDIADLKNNKVVYSLKENEDGTYSLIISDPAND